MTCFDFQTTTHAKWILAGEHAVIRNHPALAFPVPGLSLKITYVNNQEPCRADYQGEYAADIHLLFWSVLERGLELVGHNVSELRGHFTVYNDIPIGAGLGASAALCVALARWFIWQSWVGSDEIYTFAKRLEDLFHTKSSGLDIATVIANKGIYFEAGQFSPLQIAWQPKWVLSHSGSIGITSHCVKKVAELWERDKSTAEQIDTRMHQAVINAKSALTQDSPESNEQLANAINQANICFTQWGLASGAMGNHLNNLLSQGALAAKPTGSGNGGYALSLWQENLTPSQLKENNYLVIK